MEKEVFVYIDINNTPILVGRLWSRVRREKESASFEYDRSYLYREDRFALEPALMLAAGPHHTPKRKTMFGAIGDSAPDRWGRLLMRRAERRRAESENRSPHTLNEIYYLLSVSDIARQGALRFKLQSDGPFLAKDDAIKIPPLIDLPKLLSATEHLFTDTDTDEELKLLLAPGSSLGGARPKASVLDKDGQLSIAKFPHQDDEINRVIWEALALKLASQAKISVPQYRIETIQDKPILLLKRFDRHESQRIPFLSAMSMLGANDNEPRSYLEIADALRQYGATPDNDMHQLWRRMLFNIMISNTDDHLRNHGFLNIGARGWQLSPAYDLNPTPTDIKPRILSTTIDYDDGTASIALALKVADYFNLDPTQAKSIALEVASVTANWRIEATKIGLSKPEIKRMASAFEHDDLTKALTFNK